ncbi:MAG TPA: gliding motility-associated C-terminal domain-containing protein, partial [Chitinophagaceae bacterium]|nr:gliding motility-associated C-terminal domain-containing protein [Chitinophagaceae bacterium]
LPPGVYLIYYKNALGQVRVFGIVIQLNCNINYNEIIVDAGCQQHDGSITINAYQGTPPYSYSIDGINFQTSNTFTNLAPGYYYATAKDAVGATASFVLHVGERCPVLSLTTINETCSLSNGKITATASNGTTPYLYSIDGVNYQASNIFTGLPAGTYTVTTKDALGYTATATATIISGCLTVTTNSTNTTCSLPNGSISITASGGTQPYRYSLDGVNFQTSNIFAGLAAASYTVTVKDQVNTLATTNVILSDAPGPSINFVATAPSCNANDGIITIAGIGGASPLQYSIDGINFQAGNIFTGVHPGNYQPTVKDANGCIATVSTTINIDCPTITATTTNETCGNSNGSINVTGANGIPPYQYSIDGINFQTAPIFSNLPAGTYTITIKDSPGYTNTITATILSSCLQVTAVATASTCGNANGVITAMGSNGVTPYQYSLDGINFQSNPVFSGLLAGFFTVLVKDAVNTYGTVNVTINNIAGPQISVTPTNSSCLNNDGSITIAGVGGTAPIQYSLTGSNFQTANQFNNLISGIYNPIIKDANGCTSSLSVTVSLDNNLVLQTSPLTFCEGGHSNLPAVSNGTSFSWTPASSLDDSHLLNPVTSSSATIKYYITASLGVCSKKDSVLVTVNSAPRADAGSQISICKGQSATLNGSGGIYYSWSPTTYLSDPTGSNPIVNAPNATITYSLLVTDANNCQSLQPSSVTVTVISALKVFAGNDTSIIINKPLQLNVIDISNSGFSQYTWSPLYGLNDPNSQHPVVTLDRDMTYHVKATTPNGCSATDDITIKVYQGPDIYVPSAFTPNDDRLNDLLIATPVGIKTFRYFSVLNRWGQRIFYSSDPRHGWDGTLAGIRQDSGIYVWLAEGTDEKGNVIQRKGTVMLIR